MNSIDFSDLGSDSLFVLVRVIRGSVFRPGRRAIHESHELTLTNPFAQSNQDPTLACEAFAFSRWRSAMTKRIIAYVIV